MFIIAQGGRKGGTEREREREREVEEDAYRCREVATQVVFNELNVHRNRFPQRFNIDVLQGREFN